MTLILTPNRFLLFSSFSFRLIRFQGIYQKLSVYLVVLVHVSEKQKGFSHVFFVFVRMNNIWSWCTLRQCFVAHISTWIVINWKKGWISVLVWLRCLGVASIVVETPNFWSVVIFMILWTMLRTIAWILSQVKPFLVIQN